MKMTKLKTPRVDGWMDGWTDIGTLRGPRGPKNVYENEDLSPLRPPWKNAVFSSLKPLFQAGKAVLSNIF